MTIPTNLKTPSTQKISEVDISKNLTLRYIIALSAVALLSILGQILVQFALTDQLGDSRVINLAGRQRMLSQKICKSAILLAHPQIYQADAERYISDLQESFTLWHKVHTGLRAGKIMLDPPIAVKNSPKVDSMLEAVHPIFMVMYENALRIHQEIEDPTMDKDMVLKNALKEILKNENLFLKAMNQIVFQYDLEAKDRVARLQRIEMGFLLLTLIILLVEGFLIFRPAVGYIKASFRAVIESEAQAQAINEELTSVNAELQQTKEDLLAATNEKFLQQINEQKIRSVSLIKGQEKERRRIAKDIHDGLGQMMTALKLGIEGIQLQTLPEKQRLALEETKVLISKIIAETRTISFNLMPTVLSDFGIISGLKLLAEQVSKTANTNVTFNSSGDIKRLNKDLEIGIYRIAQEAINNAVKYSQASDITLELHKTDQTLVLKVSDNGKGFNLKKVSNEPEVKKYHTGITNMQERTHLLNGHCKIESTINKGTKVRVELPYIPA